MKKTDSYSEVFAQDSELRKLSDKIWTEIIKNHNKICDNYLVRSKFYKGFCFAYCTVCNYTLDKWVVRSRKDLDV